MREYGQIQCSFWSDPDIQSLSDHGKLLFAYLLTGPHSNGLGCYRLPDGYVQADFGWSPETVSKGFEQLFRKGLAYRCTSTFFVFIPKFLKWNPVTNGNVALARIKEFEAVPKKADIYLKIIKDLLEYCKHLPEPFRNHLETLSKELAKGYGKQDPILPDPEPDPDPDPILNQTQPERGLQGGRPPRVAARDSEPVTKATWERYSAAYFLRYGTEPVRNAKVNGQMKQLVERLGAEDSPHVAEHYVRSNAAWYVQRGHGVDCLLKDAEKLRTEWATGRSMTATRARQIDQTEANRGVVDETLRLLEGRA